MRSLQCVRINGNVFFGMMLVLAMICRVLLQYNVLVQCTDFLESERDRADFLKITVEYKYRRTLKTSNFEFEN
jgi:hypothetical protein